MIRKAERPMIAYVRRRIPKVKKVFGVYVHLLVDGTIYVTAHSYEKAIEAVRDMDGSDMLFNLIDSGLWDDVYLEKIYEEGE